MNLKKEVILGKDARDKLISGVEVMASAVKSTMGPKGNHVMILTSFDVPHVTKDGVTVARAVKLEDPSENLGVKSLLQAAEKTVKEAGDGTTTAIVLAEAIIKESLKLINSGVSPKNLREYLSSYFTLVKDYIRKESIPINSSEDAKKVALISSNGDEHISNLVREAYDNVGLDGIIATAESNSTKTYVEITSGMRFDRGYLSPNFINNYRNGTVEFESPCIFICDSKLRFSREVAEAINIAVELNKPLLIIADDIEAQALSTAIINKVKAGIPIACVKSPSYGNNRYNILQDIATYTGATIISDKVGLSPDKVVKEHLGSCERAIITPENTTLIGGRGNEEEIKARIEQIHGEMENAPTKYHLDKAKERIAMLHGKIATIFIGGHTDLEIREVRDRLDDTIHATRAAIEQGIVVGGGISLINALNYVESSISTENKQFYDLTYSKMCSNILTSPLKTICENAGVSYDVVSSKLELRTDNNLGYDASTDRLCNMLDEGIVDPTKVVVSALDNALSVALMILSTNAIVVQPSLSRDDVANM